MAPRVVISSDNLPADACQLFLKSRPFLLFPYIDNDTICDPEAKVRSDIYLQITEVTNARWFSISKRTFEIPAYKYRTSLCYNGPIRPKETKKHLYFAYKHFAAIELSQEKTVASVSQSFKFDLYSERLQY